MELKKGMRVRAQWLAAKPLGTFSLAGVQLKTTGTMREVIGRVKHIRGDHPTEPKVVEVWVEPDGGGEEVRVPLGSIQEVLGA